MKSTTLLCLLIWSALFTTMSQAQDAYHQSLINQLQAENNLTVNTFYISDTEAATMSQDYNPFDKLVIEEENVAARGFNMGIKLAALPDVDEKPWDYKLRFTPTQTVADGTPTLLTFWTHGIPNTEGNFGQVEVYIEETTGVNKSLLLRKFLVLKQEWQQWFLPLEGTGENIRIDLRMGNLTQSMYFGGIALMGGTNFSMSNLPLIDRHDTYEGAEPSASWRTAAEARIETHRKANLNCTVVDLNGNAVEQATVKLDMKEHAFAFGVANPGYLQANNTEYKNRLLDLDGNGNRLNNFAFEADLQWYYWDNPVENWNISRATLLNELDWLVANDFRVHGHAVLWPNNRYLNVDMTQSKAFIENAISTHINNLIGHPDINGKFTTWDVLNEPAFNVVLEDTFGFSAVLELYSDVFNQVAALDPVAKRVLNDYVPIGNGAYSRVGIERHKTIVDAIQNNTGNAIQALGFQCHMRYPVPPEEVWQLLNEYNGKADEFIITEFDLKGIDASIQGDYTYDFLTSVFSHEDVTGFTMWNFRDNPVWNHSDTPIFEDDANWTIKPSGQSFIQRVFTDWWSNEQENTAPNGQATIRAFKGTHDIRATYAGIDFEPQEITLNEDMNYTIVLPIIIEDASCNIVENGNFQDVSNWSHVFPLNNGSGTFSVVNGEAIITSNYAGTGWHEQLRQQNLSLIGGKQYYAKIEAYAAANCQIAIEIANGSPAHFFDYVQLTTTPQLFSLPPFTMNVSDSNVDFNVYLGYDDATVYIKSIQLIELGCSPPVCAVNQNGNFGNATTGWSLPLNGGQSTATMTVNNDGILDIDISDAGTAGWHCQLRQNGIILEAGATYSLTFEAYADATRDIKVELAESSSPYNAYDDENFTISTTMQTYQLADFTVPVSDPSGRLNIYLGNDNTNIHFDNFWLTKLDCNAAACMQQLAVNHNDIPDGTYQSQQNTSSAGTIKDGRNVMLKSGDRIILQSNFEVKPGANLSIEIDACDQ